MTTLTLLDAAILAHLSKQPIESRRKRLTRRLSPAAKIIAKTLRGDRCTT